MRSIGTKRFSQVCRAGLWIICFLALSAAAPAQEKPHIYSTGEVLELDRVASAWLIKRYVDTSAVFRFFPQGQFITEGTAFDTPDARLCRTHNQSTFEVIRKHYGIDDPGLDELTRIIHEVEIDYWAGKKTTVSVAVVRTINDYIKEAGSPEQCLKRCFEYFDKLVSL